MAQSHLHKFQSDLSRDTMIGQSTFQAMLGDFWATKITDCLTVLILIVQSCIFARQARLMGHQLQTFHRTVELTRKEFVASHRPKLRLKHIWIASLDGKIFSGRIQGGVPITVRLDIVTLAEPQPKLPRSILSPACSALASLCRSVHLITNRTTISVSLPKPLFWEVESLLAR